MADPKKLPALQICYRWGLRVPSHPPTQTPTQKSIRANYLKYRIAKHHGFFYFFRVVLFRLQAR